MIEHELAILGRSPSLVTPGTTMWTFRIEDHAMLQIELLVDGQWRGRMVDVKTLATKAYEPSFVEAAAELLGLELADGTPAIVRSGGWT